MRPQVIAPTGWVELENHLNEWHAIPFENFDGVDTDALRALHARLHSAAPSFQRRADTRPHVHA